MGKLAIRLPDELHDRLHHLSEQTARPQAYYVKMALAEYLDDIEDVHPAEAAVERIKRGEEEVINAEEFWRGMDDGVRCLCPENRG